MKRLLHSVLARFGYRIVRINDSPKPSEGLDPFFTLLQRLGFAPKHILDVGANRGLWTRTAIQHFPDARYTLVEPQDHLKSCIKDLLDRGYKIQWINAGAGAESGILPLTLAPQDGSSTLVLIDRHGHTTGSQKKMI